MGCGPSRQNRLAGLFGARIAKPCALRTVQGSTRQSQALPFCPPRRRRRRQKRRWFFRADSARLFTACLSSTRSKKMASACTIRYRQARPKRAVVPRLALSNKRSTLRLNHRAYASPNYGIPRCQPPGEFAQFQLEIELLARHAGGLDHLFRTSSNPARRPADTEASFDDDRGSREGRKRGPISQRDEPEMLPPSPTVTTPSKGNVAGRPDSAAPGPPPGLAHGKGRKAACASCQPLRLQADAKLPDSSISFALNRASTNR
jgi:hypothetical protein